MKESLKAGREKPVTGPQEAPGPNPPSARDREIHHERMRAAEGRLLAARTAYAEAATPSAENKRADTAYSEYLQEEVPVTNISGASLARRIDIINGRSSYEEDLNTLIMDAEAASSAAELEREPSTFLMFGQKAHKAWEAKRAVAREALVAAREKKAAFEQLKAAMAAEAKNLELATTAGRMAESKRLEATYTEELRTLGA